MTTEKPPIEEPSVLDYLKSRLRFWQHGVKVELPPENIASTAPSITAEPVSMESLVPISHSALAVEGPEKKNRLPWRSLLALVLALIAQRSWEPAQPRTAAAGIVLYALSLGLVFWAYRRKEWILMPLKGDSRGMDTLKVRTLPLLIGIPLAMLAFATLGGNLFTPLNVTLWVAAIASFVWAFWAPRIRARSDVDLAIENGPTILGNVLANDKVKSYSDKVVEAHQGDKAITIGSPFKTRYGGSLVLDMDGSYIYTPPAWNLVPSGGLEEQITYTVSDEHQNTASSELVIKVSDSDRPLESSSLWQRLVYFVRKDSWSITATRWTLLVLAVVGIIIFFRVYHLNAVPSEPFSDHAEKILDVYDVSQGQTHIFFPRNTGRESMQMYLTLLVSWIFGTGLSFISLKIGTVIVGLVTLPYIYLLGKELGGKRLGLLAVFFAGIAYWPNVISRVGLRFPLYPLFVAPTLYYLIRGLRTRNRNDFILSGLFLGFGLHGYSPFRIVPLVVVIAVGLYLLHAQSRGGRKQAVIWLGIVALVSFIVFIPLARYWVENPSVFDLRAFSRVTGSEAPLPGPAWQIFLSNLWNGLKMFNWNDGEIWVHSVTFRPALDVVSGALFILGIFLLLMRYIRQRHWLDLFLLLSVPLLQLPSTLSLAFPAENPALNRAAGAAIPVFLIVALALDGLLAGISSLLNRRSASALSGVVVLFLGGMALFQNYDLVFRQYAIQFDSGAWNTSEMGAVIKQFGETYGTTDSVWIVPYPYWVDTRLPGVWAGIPNRDFALWPQDISTTQGVQGTKLIMLNTADAGDVKTLEHMYPQGVLSTFHSATKLPGKDFLMFFIPPGNAGEY